MGKIFIEKEPAIAGKLISMYLPKTEPAEKDYSKIPAYFISYCQVQGLRPQDYVGNLYKSSKVHVRRTFIACILHIYAPQLFFQPVDELILDRVELSKTLSDLFLQKKSNISTMIREVVMWEKQYEDFAENVNEIIEKILGA